MSKKGEPLEDTAERDARDAWKRPWLITHGDDEDFEVCRKSQPRTLEKSLVQRFCARPARRTFVRKTERGGREMASRGLTEWRLHQHVFEARREGDKRSKKEQLCHVHLTKARMPPCPHAPLAGRAIVRGFRVSGLDPKP